MTIKFSIPANFSREHVKKLKGLLKYINNNCNNNIVIDNVYGSLSYSLFGHARDPKSLPNVNFEYFKEYINKLADLEIPFHYTLNNLWCCGLERTKQGQNEIYDELNELLEAGVKGFIIANPYLIKLVRRWFSKIKIIASINLRINSLQKFQFYINLGVDHIVLDRDVNRNFNFLKSILSNFGNKFTLLVNSTCQFLCPLQDYHTLENGTLSSKFLNSSLNYLKNGYLNKDFCFEYCINEYLENFENFLKSPWIIPEYISIYEKLGIEYFKIQGRTISVDNQIKLLKAYIDRKTPDKNLFFIWPRFKDSLLLFCKKKKPQKEKEIRNLIFNTESLVKINFINFFLNNSRDCRLGCNNCHYCKKQYEKLKKLNS
ncbi:MAG: U32 family peptidase [Candidatus Helarchaeota archaeon]